MDRSVYERLGGSDAITKISSDLVDIHLANSKIAPRYVSSDSILVKKQVAAFFIAGTGGPDNYEGKDMLAAHKGMNINNDEFVAVLDDAILALDKNGIGQKEKEEVLYILYSMKPEIVYV